MKRLNYLLIIVIASTLAGCGLANDNGELTGVQGRRKWFHPQPFGTVYIPTGTYHTGQSDQDVQSAQIGQNRQVSIPAFYMDDTEISNNEYRQFVYHVVDSLMRQQLSFMDAKNPDFIDYQKKFTQADMDQVVASELYYQEADKYFKRTQWDVRNIKYKWWWEDVVAAAAYNERARRWDDKGRKDFIREETFSIYPDTLVWARDFTYSFNDPMTSVYFWHPKYDDYPVVGVNWNQARAFCNWRTEHINNFYRSLDPNEPTVTDFRLPTEYEFEYAARGGRDGNPYPWGGPYVRNTKGCFLANFKPGRGNYIDDGGIYTVKVNAYFPNDYGLYCMSGNLAEWTSTSFAESGQYIVNDLSPEYRTMAKYEEDDTYKRKMTRGGSWKDIAYYIQNGTRSQYEYQDSAKAFVGFRCALTYIGRSNKDKD